ncbi:MAG: aminoglycoside 6'-N-acetyltransferase [Bacteroidia bacterium]
MNTMYIYIASAADLDDLTKMGTDLWPENSEEEMRKILTELMGQQKNEFFLFRRDGQNIGFIFMSLRSDYVEGSNSSPVGYVEGIYVKPEHRRKGVSAQLLKRGQEWAKEKGCSQIGSDIYADNKVSYDFHKAIGFREAGRLIAFIKDL